MTENVFISSGNLKTYTEIIENRYLKNVDELYIKNIGGYDTDSSPRSLQAVIGINEDFTKYYDIFKNKSIIQVLGELINNSGSTTDSDEYWYGDTKICLTDGTNFEFVTTSALTTTWKEAHTDYEPIGVVVIPDTISREVYSHDSEPYCYNKNIIVSLKDTDSCQFYGGSNIGINDVPLTDSGTTYLNQTPAYENESSLNIATLHSPYYTSIEDGTWHLNSEYYPNIQSYTGGLLNTYTLQKDSALKSTSDCAINLVCNYYTKGTKCIGIERDSATYYGSKAWYMPSLVEMLFLCAKNESINNAFKVCHNIYGSEYDDLSSLYYNDSVKRYWTSTLLPDKDAPFYIWVLGTEVQTSSTQYKTCYYISRTEEGKVRPFCAI